MNPRIILLTGAIGLVFFICLFTAKMFTSGFNLGNHGSRGIWVAAFSIPVLYIGSFLSASYANALGRTYYFTINIVAGIVFYLFLGAIILGVISLFYYAFNTLIPLSVVWIIFGTAVLLAATAFIQARIITTVEYTVTLADAPASWEGKTAALVSDTHFGLINHKKFSDKVVDKILSLNPDFVLHAGDFYDGPKVDTAPITESWTRLASQIPVFYAPGNHEIYGDYRVFVDSVRNAGGTVLEDDKTIYDGVQIAGTVYHAGKEPSEIADTLATLNLDPSIPAILINHPPTAFAGPNQYGVDLIVSGHTHRGQTWPFRYVTQKVYGEYNYGMHPYESLISITTSGVGTFGPPIRLFNTPEIVLIHFKVK